MRRRNKPKVVWIPITNAGSVDPLNRSTIQTAGLAIDHSAVGNFETVEIPCVLDGIQSSPLDATSTLSDIENSGYRLRRIVGEIYLQIPQSEKLINAHFIVTAGFIIRRTNQGGASLAAQGAASEIACDDIENSMDPWIWRRSWFMAHLGEADASAAPNQANDFRMRFSEPHNNFTSGNGSLYTGPHVDQKTARIVSTEERLFLDVTATVVLAGNIGVETTSALIVHSNLRVLGSMRAQLGNRRNASR